MRELKRNTNKEKKKQLRRTALPNSNSDLSTVQGPSVKSQRVVGIFQWARILAWQNLDGQMDVSTAHYLL